MSILANFPWILHGGDYNPDQWLKTPEIIRDDFRLMDESACNAFSIGIFSWSQYEPEEGKYDFSWLDDLMQRCWEHGKRVFLATPSGARPAWLGHHYPETCRVAADGKREAWGYRHNHCWTSPVMREKLAKIIGLLAERYASHPALGGWHISNEYSGACFCNLCRQEFLAFLKQRYGTLDRLNEVYWSGFWGHRYSAWDQIDPLDRTMDLSELDHQRFLSRQIADFLRFEIAQVRRFSDAPATTNMMGIFPGVDYWRLAEACDFIADDCYPTWYKGETENVAAHFSMLHDIHYSMKRKPFLMMESCPGIPNYKPYCKMRRPGEFQREMLMALGHGADGTMYFQWRKGRGNCEKIHGAVVGHDGTNQTLVFQSVADYGHHLTRISEIVDSTISPQAAVIFDWESNWALASTKGFGGRGMNCEGQRLNETVSAHYRALWKHNVSLGVIESTCDFSPYKLLVAPMLYLMKPGVMERLVSFVQNGGTLLMTYLSAYVDENNLCFFGGNPGGEILRRLFGIWNEEIDIFEPATAQTLRLNGFTLDGANEFPVLRRCEYLHAEGAEIAGVYGSDFYAGSPALTRNRFGKGNAWYLAADTDDEFLKRFYGKLLNDCGIQPVLSGLPDPVSVSKRSKDGNAYYFLLNMSDDPQTVHLPHPMTDLWNGGANLREIRLNGAGSTVLKSER